MDVKCTVDFGGIEDKLQQLGPKLARRALRKAVGKVGDMWVSEMKAKVPTDTNDLRESIDKKVSARRRGDTLSAVVSVGPTTGGTPWKKGSYEEQPALYGLFVEMGTKHSRPQPFMRPVFDTTGEKAVQLLADTLREDLELIVKS